MKKAKIWVLALSGHGPSCLDSLIMDHNIMTFLMVDDFGGDTKTQIHFIETMFKISQEPNGVEEIQRISDSWKKLYPKTYKKIESIRPPGDLKSNQIRFAQYLNKGEKGKEISELLFFRSNNFLEVKNATLKLLTILNVSNNLKKRADQFLEIYQKYLEEFTNNSILDTKTSVGNLFNNFLMCEYFGEDKKFFNEIKRLKLLPKHVRFEFISKTRAILVASDSQTTLIGEDVIDKNNNPITPHSYTLVDKSPPFNKKVEIKLDVLEEYFKKAEFIIIPPGSIANQLPLINAIAPKIISWGKPVFWIINSFIHNGEAEVIELVRYFYTKQNGLGVGIKPIILSPKLSPYEFLGESIKQGKISFEIAIHFINEYILQSKKPVMVTKLLMEELEKFPLASKRTFSIIDFILQKPGEGGIRYSQEQLKRIFELITDIVRKEKDTNKTVEFLRKIFGDNMYLNQSYLEESSKEQLPPII